MKVIFSIAKNEFRYLFYSPIAWFVLLVFLVQCGYFYTDPVYGFANSQDIMLKNVPSFTGYEGSLTEIIFLKTEFFPNIMRNLFLFIPVLTMGLISRESNNGTNALLYSSPVSIRRIVLGKYAGIMLYNLLLVLVIAIFLLTGMLNIQNADYGALLSALLGFYLLVCTYSAIGLFMSSLSNYQVVSALATFMAIFVLSRIGSLWQRYDLVRDLTWFLSLQDRTVNMLKGLIITKDLIYFVMVSLMFMAFTYFRLTGILQFRPWYIRTGRYLATIAVVLTIGYTFSRPALTGYLDTTDTQRNTLAPETQKLLQEFRDSTLEVTLYTNLLGDGLQRGMPEARNVDYLNNFWAPYLRFKPDIKFNYVYYYAYDAEQDDSTFIKRYKGKSLDDIAGDYIEMYDASPGMFLPESQIQPVKGLRAECSRLVMQVKFQGRTAFLRTFQDNRFWPDEFHSIAAFNRVLGTPMPAAVFSTGSLERNIHKTGQREYAFHTTYKKNRISLLNLGFNSDTINLLTQSIPEKINALVIADPKVELSNTVQQKVANYVSKGGNLMLFGEPGKQHVINPLLQQFGMQLKSGQLVRPDYDETPDKIVAYLTQPGRNMVTNIPGVTISDDTMKVLLPGAATITGTVPGEWKSDSIAITYPNSAWLKMGPFVNDSILPPFDPLAGDSRQTSFPVIRKLSRNINGNDQRVLIAGDADFASNMRFAYNRRTILAAYSWMAGNKFPVFLKEHPNKDVMLNIGERAAHYQKIVYVWIIPALVLLAGTILLIRRKRK
ncbi:MAG: ABC transporter permease subunit [Pseudobacter sp.]|uniref:ABC transporter permease subunit n=1 Tax=Pseudobacter sp. TaxID=2045420 RepID=UPI003F805EBE